MIPDQSFGAMCRDALNEGIVNESSTEADPDRHLSRHAAAGHALVWVREMVAERDDQAWAHYEDGLAAIRHGEYAQAIHAFEQAVRLYEAIHSDVFAQRGAFESDQPRRTLADTLWGYYYHLHEAVVAWANSAVASQDDPTTADQWHVSAQEAFQVAVSHAIEWWRTIERWAAEAE